MKKSIIWAAAIAIVITLWVVTGDFVSVNSVKATADQPAESTALPEETLFLVEAQRFSSLDFTREITVRARTEALRVVEMKSETEGRVIATPVEEGMRVTEGQLLCQLDPNDREANLAEAAALVAQRELELNAAIELARKGHRSETQVSAAQAQYDAALAGMRRAEVALAQTRVTAPFSGVVDDRPMEIGDFMQKGTVCAKVIYEDTFLAVGEVSEQDVHLIEAGQAAHVTLVSGETIEGVVRFVSKSANQDTRTFRVEVTIDNADRSLRDGTTAEMVIPVAKGRAHQIAANLLVLNDDGRIGVRANDNGLVKFYPVEILNDDFASLWVDGLPNNVQLITVGQAFVVDGQKINIDLKE